MWYRLWQFSKSMDQYCFSGWTDNEVCIYIIFIYIYINTVSHLLSKLLYNLIPYSEANRSKLYVTTNWQKFHSISTEANRSKFYIIINWQKLNSIYSQKAIDSNSMSHSADKHKFAEKKVSPHPSQWTNKKENSRISDDSLRWITSVHLFWSRLTSA